VRFSPRSCVGAWHELHSTYSETLSPNEGPDHIDLNLDELFEIAVRKVICGLEGSTKSAPQSEIEHQITSRDYRLIDQADCVVVYRPTRGKDEWKIGGTLSEASYALMRKKPVIVITDRIDGDLAEGSLPTRIAKHAMILEQENLKEEQQRADVFARAATRIIENLRGRPHFRSINLSLCRAF
jgi:nucleoside 2-deoxyribosyltransferase